jgi:2-methylisocitrate lyase-like PEP mutase family enzyme
MVSSAERLRALLAQPGLLPMPCCFDALSARLVESAGFPLTLMSGFAVSATRLALPDTGLISYAEMLDQGRDICAAVRIPVIGDADTGYGNPVNVKRTLQGYARAGFACAMIEDQQWPKRCGHTEGKQVVSRDEAFARVRAAVDAQREGADVLILARTDARQTHGLDEALTRIRGFEELGADIVFLEAPESVDEMRAFCQATRLPTLANMLENGKTPLLPSVALQDLGFKIAAYPLTLLSSAVAAMQAALRDLSRGVHPRQLVPFAELQELVGFPNYDRERARYE